MNHFTAIILVLAFAAGAASTVQLTSWWPSPRAEVDYTQYLCAHARVTGNYSQLKRCI